MGNRSKQGGEDAGGVQSLDRALRVLEWLGKSGGELSVTDTARRLEVDKSTASRLLRTLERRGFLDRVTERRTYRLGLSLLRYGAAVLRDFQVAERGGPFLRRLRDETGELAHLAVWTYEAAVIVKQEERMGMLRVTTEVGHRSQAHCTAVGKVLLAYLPDDEAEHVIAGELPRFTDRTITDSNRLKAHLKRVRSQGYAVDDEELEIGVRCVASPVWNHDGQVVASMGVSGPATRVTASRVPELARLVMAINGEFSKSLGYQGPSRTAGSRRRIG